MAKIYFVTTASHLVPVEGILSDGVMLYEMEEKDFKKLSSPGSFHELTKSEYDAEKKMASSKGFLIGSEQIQQPPAQAAEEDKLDESEILKVSKVKAPEKPQKKKGKK
tara:strand:+ start:150 stop:473 length:324 start_codon:yes stop_codon:yes gene_type:complete